tara:strand:+ start:16569 stop:19118 length:2550 start_codon:yes stop_codon:yes gene_type:complete
MKQFNMDKDNRNISSMYKDWFLDYASYVILERAIPDINDGLKPVQKRILHSMSKMHDGRYNKVANIIGHTMQYHPHGDQAIGDALVGLGQKDLLIDTQGNWGDIRTGDRAAAPRYIEARLSEFALEVLFNKNITKWKSSYDGRNKEPIALPVRFPLVLNQGVEGIAVGLATKILPHNFNELIKASISILKDKSFRILPDFQSGGMIDVSQYNQGKKGGRVRVRAHIDILDKVTIRISSVPYGVTTTSLIDSIIKANDSGKIKIKNIEDNTAENIDIIIRLTKGTSPNVVVDALYAFTHCEISISPNCCIIVDNKPEFLSVNDLLRISTSKTIALLKEDLEYSLKSLENQWHKLTLEKIFIENKIYRNIEDCETWDSIIAVIRKSLKPYLQLLKKNVDDDDISLLTEIKIKRITKYDSDRQKIKLVNIESEIEEVNNDIKYIKEYAIRYFEHLIKKFGSGRDRKTQIESFDSISVRRVAIADQKLYLNKKDGFIGTSPKEGEFVCKCSKLDNIIVILSDGTLVVTKIADKKYIGKDIIYANVWKKNDKHMIYNIAYIDNDLKVTYVKRFPVTSIILDKVYNVAGKNKNSRIIYLTANPNSESEIVQVYLHYTSKTRNKAFDYDYSNLSIKGRDAKGNILSKHKVRKITHKESGESTLGGRKIWIDKNIGKLNIDKRGDYLGSFDTNDRIIVIYSDGNYEMTDFDLLNRYKMAEIVLIEKFDKNQVYTLLYYNGKNKQYFIKRFNIETNVLDKKYLLISDTRGSKLINISSSPEINISYNYRMKNGDKKNKIVFNQDVVSVKGWKSIGNRLDNKSRMSGFDFKIINQSIDEDKKDDKIIEDNNKSDNLTLF